MLDPKLVDAYIEVLQNELLLATGCTEPIAIAYAAAILRQTLGKLPERIRVEVSGNIIKNVPKYFSTWKSGLINRIKPNILSP